MTKRNANTDNKVNKFVTLFARVSGHLPGPIIWTNPTAPLPIYQICIPGLLTSHLPALHRDTQLTHQVCTMTAKSAPWFPRHRDYFSTKAPGR